MTSPPLSPEFLALQRAVAGRFSLVRELGRGGMGIVYLARDVALDRLVAIKLLPPGLAAQPAFRERFLREARMAASLAHPHIVPIHLVESTGEIVYFVMAFVDGETLGERVRRRGPMDASDVMRVVQEVAWALGHAHARGVVHRDIKPDNILLDRESGRVLVTDFGIAGAAAGSTPAEGLPAGTPHYLSPEVARGERGDARADLYALGVTAWYALTGSHPFEAPTLPALLVKQASEPPPPLGRIAPHASPRFARAIDRCLAAEAEKRWPGAEALAVELDAARTRAGRLAAPVRVFLAEALPVGDDVATGLVGAGTAAAALGLIGRGSGLFDGLVTSTVLVASATLFLGLALLRVGSLGIAARDLIEAGYDFAAARIALASDDAERGSGEDRERRTPGPRRVVTYTLTAAIKEAIALWLATRSGPWWVSLPGLVLSVLIPPFTVRTLWRMLRGGLGLWSRILQGRAGRALFAVARLLSRHPTALAADAQSTIAALGSDAEGTFLRLPLGVRDDLRDVPRLLSALGREAEALRAKADDPVAAERLATVVAAIEAMRLDLLSVEAGLVTIPDVTRHLQDAERIAQAVDDALATARADALPLATEDRASA
jgi:eukaryotic-like serine/threonine-protein kinase